MEKILLIRYLETDGTPFYFWRTICIYFAGYSRYSSSPFFGDRWQMKLMNSLQIHYNTKSKEGQFLDNKTATRNSVEK
jgi:hypothetical protein